MVVHEVGGVAPGGRGKRLPLIVTADDYGLTDATSRAIIEAHQRGIVTATSALAVAPGVVERLRWLDDAPGISVGAHLALIGEDPPLLGRTEIPTLVDRSGRLRPSWRQLVPLLALGRIDPADIHRELSAQVSLLEAHRPLSHLDAHQHLLLWPVVGRVVVDLAARRGISRVRVPRSGRRGPRAAAIGRLADRLAATAAGAGLATTGAFRGLDEAGGWTGERLTTALADLAALGRSAELNVHPGAAVDPDRARFRWGYAWGQELAALTDPGLRLAVEHHGFDLVGDLESGGSGRGW